MKTHENAVNKFCELVPSYRKLLDMGYEVIPNWFTSWYENNEGLSEIHSIDLWYGDEMYIEINEGDCGDSGLTYMYTGKNNTIHWFSWEFLDTLYQVRKELGWIKG